MVKETERKMLIQNSKLNVTERIKTCVNDDAAGQRETNHWFVSFYKEIE